MTLLAPTLQAWFTDRLMTQRNASPRTIAAYRDTLRLLLALRPEQTGKEPCQLDFADLDAPLIGAFLNHLEQDRGNSPQDPQRAPGRDPLALPLRRAAPPRARRHDRPRDRDPDQTPPANHDLLPRPGRDRRVAPSARPDHLARPTRPRDAPHRDPDRRARLRTREPHDHQTCRSAPERTYGYWGRAARNAARCSPARPSRSSTHGCANAKASRTSRCSRPAAAGR